MSNNIAKKDENEMKIQHFFYTFQQQRMTCMKECEKCKTVQNFTMIS